MPGFIGRDEVRRLMDKGAQVVDVLESSQYEESHLPGAVNVPLWEMDEDAVDGWDRDRPVVVYCYDTQ